MKQKNLQNHVYILWFKIKKLPFNSFDLIAMYTMHFYSWGIKVQSVVVNILPHFPGNWVIYITKQTMNSEVDMVSFKALKLKVMKAKLAKCFS